jgi:hypothetical protein
MYVIHALPSKMWFSHGEAWWAGKYYTTEVPLQHIKNSNFQGAHKNSAYQKTATMWTIHYTMKINLGYWAPKESNALKWSIIASISPTFVAPVNYHTIKLQSGYSNADYIKSLAS